MPNRHGQDDEYRYGFNGHEKDDEVRGTKGASYDFGARMFDPRVARFLSTDPWEDKYPWQSSYVYFRNSPIATIDWKGLGGGNPDEFSDGAVSSTETSTKKKEIVNIAIVNKTRDATLEQDYQKLKKTNYIIVEATSTKDAADQIDKLLGDDKKIGSLFISSHGGRRKSSTKFSIGSDRYKNSSQITNSKNLKRISKHFNSSSTSKIIVASCHAGSAVNNGEQLMKSFSKTMGVTVYAHRSWSYTSSFSTLEDHVEGDNYQGNSRTPSTEEYNKAKYQWDNDGIVIKVKPNGTVSEYNNVSYGTNGRFYGDVHKEYLGGKLRKVRPILN